MSGLSRKQKRTEARREYERFTKLWRDELRMTGLYGKKTKFRRPTFSQWYAQHEHEFGSPPAQQLEVPQYPNSFGEDPWAEQLDQRVTEEPKEERGVATIQIVGDEEV